MKRRAGVARVVATENQELHEHEGVVVKSLEENIASKPLRTRPPRAHAILRPEAWNSVHVQRFERSNITYYHSVLVQEAPTSKRRLIPANWKLLLPVHQS
jgi:hypothetical protein